MYIDEKAKGEAPVKVTKLSQAIRLGALSIQEDIGWSGCALGTALGYLRGKEIREWSGEANGVFVFDQLYRILGPNTPPREILQTASILHLQGRMNRQQVADWLERQGY